MHRNQLMLSCGEFYHRKQDDKSEEVVHMDGCE